MNINNSYLSIQNKSKVSFGYDKKLSKELESELKNYKKEKEWANSILQLNTYCNQIEKNIIEQEKKKKTDTSNFSGLVELFSDLKQILAQSVEITFEKLNYSARESRHYEKEYMKNKDKPNDWRLQVMENIAWMSDDPPELFKKEEEKVLKMVDEASSENDNEDEIVYKEFEPETNESKKSKKKTKFIKEYKPTAESPKGFCDVAGMEEVKSTLEDGIMKALKNPEEAKLDFEEYGRTVPRGILLYGPPGCGKTFITKALSQEAEVPLYLLNLSDIGSGYVNVTSKNINLAFEEIIQCAKDSGKPSLLFMDELDTMAFNRDGNTFGEDIKQVGTLLQVMDKADENNVFIIGATNKYALLDPAVRRRFDAKLLVDVPDITARKALLTNFLSGISKGKELAADEESIEKIAELLQGYSNDSICKISKEAGNNALKRNRDNIKFKDYETAIKNSTEEKPNRRDFLSEEDLANQTGRIGFELSSP